MRVGRSVMIVEVFKTEVEIVEQNERGERFNSPTTIMRAYTRLKIHLYFQLRVSTLLRDTDGYGSIARCDQAIES